MTKFFLALIGMAVAALVGTFVFAAFTIQAGHLVALKPASTTVETPELFTRYVEPRRKRDGKKARYFDMPRYYFDVRNGHRLIDPTGLECRDDQDAITQATFIAAQIAIDVPNTSGGRSVAVLNSVKEEISKVPVHTNSKGDHQGGEQAGRRQRPQGRGEEANAAQVEADGQVRLDQA